jgi:hypothetical protein
MTIIDPGQGVAAAVRAQIEALRERDRGPSRTGGTSPAQQARRRPHTVSPAMSQRIQALDADDPDRRRKAVRIYLEAELAREFGGGLLNDPAFAGMLDAVQGQMEADAPTAAAIDALGRLLVAGKIQPA